MELSAWNAGHALGVISANLALEGDRSGFRAQGTLEPPGLSAGAFDADFSGSYHARVLTIARLRLRHAASGAIADAQGSVTVMAGGPRLDLRGEWTQFRWPLAAADAPIHSERGGYTLQGQRPYALSAQGQLRAASGPELQIALRGRLARDALSVDSAELEAWGAHSQLTGELRWAPAAAWRVQGRINDLDVAQLRPGIAGRLSAALSAAGRGYRTHSELEARITELSGTLRGQRAAGHAQIARRGTDWLFSDVRLALGATRIELDGRAGAALNLNFALDAADLGLFQPGAHGRLSARGSVRGDLHDPTLVASAQGRELDFAGLQLAALDANIDFDPHGSARADSTLALQDLQIAGRRLDLLTLRLEGATAEHRLALEARAEGLTLTARGSAHYAAGQWQAHIASADLTNQARLHMSLDAPTQLLLSAERLRLDQSCLHDQQAHLCAWMMLDATQRSVALRATDLPMRAMTAGSDRWHRLRRHPERRGSMPRRPAAQPWRGSVQCAARVKAAIHTPLANGRIETLDLGTGNITRAGDRA